MSNLLCILEMTVPTLQLSNFQHRNRFICWDTTTSANRSKECWWEKKPCIQMMKTTTISIVCMEVIHSDRSADKRTTSSSIVTIGHRNKALSYDSNISRAEFYMESNMILKSISYVNNISKQRANNFDPNLPWNLFEFHLMPWFSVFCFTKPVEEKEYEVDYTIFHFLSLPYITHID